MSYAYFIKVWAITNINADIITPGEGGLAQLYLFIYYYYDYYFIGIVKWLGISLSLITHLPFNSWLVFLPRMLILSLSACVGFDFASIRLIFYALATLAIKKKISY